MKLLIIFLCVIIGFAVLISTINFYLSPQDELKKADVIVAISGGDTEARAKEAADLYEQGLAPKILFSGAALDPLSPSNAKVMKNVALEAGVAPVDILLEERAQNTTQNAVHSGSILESANYKRIILVTSPYHQRRAYIEFQDKLGDEVEIINKSSEDRNWSDTWWLRPWSWWLAISEMVKTAVTGVMNLF